MQVAPTITVHSLVRVPADSHARLRQYAKVLSGKEYSAPSPLVTKILERLFIEPNIDYQQLSCVTTSVLRCDPEIKRAILVCQRRNLTPLSRLLREKSVQAALNTELMHAVLTKTVVKDLKMETLLAELRSTYLSSIVDPTTEFDYEPHLELMVSLAVQCFRNEYFYAMPSGDEKRLARLKDDLTVELDAYHSGVRSARLEPMLAVCGMYLSLMKMDSNHQILKLKGEDLAPSFQKLIDEQVRYPYEELAIREAIPSLGTAENQVSRAVGRQYEESPYPRWFSFSSKEPESLASTIVAKFPHLTPGESTEVTEILVAGCGTGRHAIAVAKKFLNSNVLAVDLSKASLAYAIRKGRELGVNNVKFCQADILCLGQLNTRFHLIEAVGVLHHMEDPARALQILTELLVPGGFMRIGLYSKLGREALNPAKEFVRTRKSGAPGADLRAIRQEMIETEDATKFKFALRTYDSFTLSEFRDLLCHEHEVQFTLPEIADILERLKLDFVGFEHIPSESKTDFQRRFPHEHQLRDFILWDRFERENPQMFESMYRFWVQKNE